MRPRFWLVAILALLGILIAGSVAMGSRDWEGIDAAVVEKQAADLGREPGTPLFSLQGDLLLFAFAGAGAVGGFAAGYFWRGLFGGPVMAAQRRSECPDG